MNSNAKIALISDLQVSGRLVLVELLGICRLHVEILRFGSLGVRLRVRVSSVCARVLLLRDNLPSVHVPVYV